MSLTVTRPVEAGDIDFVAAHLCAGELRTMYDTCGPDVDVKGKVASAVMLSENPLTAVRVEDGRPLSLIGVVPLSLLEGQGSLWFLATDAAFEHPMHLVRAGRRYVRSMLERFPHIVGRVDARHEGTLKLLRLMGFDVRPPVRDGEVYFCFYEMRGA